MKAFDNTRWCFVDGMRGIAALGVLFSHLAYHNPLQTKIFATLPLPLSLFCFYGEHGVQIFFVISGFVIAHSLRNNTATGPELRNFILRRQFRLDPPYWAAMAFAFAIMFARNFYPGYAPLPLPSPGEILANVFYLQRILDTARILGVAWTLCLEVQFYLFFILLLALGRWLGGGRRSASLEALMLLITGMISVAVARGVDRYAEIAWTWLPYQWLYFAGGVLCYLSVRDRRHDAMFGLFLAFMVAALSWGNRWNPTFVFGLLTMLTFWIVGKTGRLTTWLRQEIFQYFGRISYSLYLVHFPIVLKVVRFGYDRSGENMAMAMFWFCLAGAISLVAAHVFYHWVEKPSVRLASSLKRPQDESKSPSPSESEPEINPVQIAPPVSRPTSLFPAMASRIGRIDPA